LQNYKSAVISLRNTLRDFPDTEHREEIMFLILKSNYLLARNSIEELRMERLQETINEYYAYIDEFPTSPRSKEAEKIYASCVKAIKRQ
jgi:outer membrane protein assembly factor BamD